MGGMLAVDYVRTEENLAELEGDEADEVEERLGQAKKWASLRKPIAVVNNLGKKTIVLFSGVGAGVEKSVAQLAEALKEEDVEVDAGALEVLAAAAKNRSELRNLRDELGELAVSLAVRDDGVQQMLCDGYEYDSVAMMVQALKVLDARGGGCMLGALGASKLKSRLQSIQMAEKVDFLAEMVWERIYAFEDTAYGTRADPEL